MRPLLVSLITLALVSIGEAQSQSPEDSLKSFLKRYLGPDGNAGTRYKDAFVDLNGDGEPEAMVYLTSPGWCGSGGCTLLILTREGASFRIITRLTITWPPIRVLNNSVNGWHNIAIWVRGGGVRPGYEAELRFDGKTYAANPSMPPAKAVAGKLGGKVVISGSGPEMPLY